MGIEPFLVSSTVEGVMAQRLVRTICPDCKTPFVPHIDELPLDFPTGAAAEALLTPGAALPLVPFAKGERGTAPTIYKGAGCRACRQTGFRGRTGIHELMVMTDSIREMVVTRVNAGVIRHEAMKLGMKSLRQDGWRKVLMGQTTVDEVARVTAGDVVM
jgi:general secretion pathway protein E/type IV pilus assembly protein PilB